MVMSSVRTSLLWSVEIRKVWRELFYHLEVKTCFLYHSFSYNAHAVSHQRHTRKIVRILEPVMSADKYLSIFSRQMEAIFYTCVRRWGSKEKKKQEVKLKKLKKRLISNVRQSFTSLKEVPKTLSVYLHNENNGIFRYRFVLAFNFKMLFTITLQLFVLQLIGYMSLRFFFVRLFKFVLEGKRWKCA